MGLFIGFLIGALSAFLLPGSTSRALHAAQAFRLLIERQFPRVAARVFLYLGCIAVLILGLAFLHRLWPAGEAIALAVEPEHRVRSGLNRP